jgi:hypothetical protein
LFRYGRIIHHGAFVNIREQRMQPIGTDHVMWGRLRRQGRSIFRSAGT